MATPIPIYTPESIPNPAYHLRYTWAGWPSAGKFPAWPSDDGFWNALDEAWQSDGLRRLEGEWKASEIQFTFSVRPHVSPVMFVSRVKGRLQHALRNIDRPVKFSRKVAFRTIGTNTRTEVQQYIRSQVSKEPLADDRFAKRLQEFSVTDPSARLDLPTQTNSGRYWYNLHMVLVTDARARMVDVESLTSVREGCRTIAKRRGHRIGELSVMPDHVHMALRADIDLSPEQVALQFLNNLAYLFGQNAVYRHGYYAGSFGEYDMNAVRHR